MTNQSKITPEQSIEVLRNIVQHPHLRFLNLQEFSTALDALACLNEIVSKPAPNVVPLVTVGPES